MDERGEDSLPFPSFIARTQVLPERTTMEISAAIGEKNVSQWRVGRPASTCELVVQHIYVFKNK